jgi:hypothetical protein
MTPAGRRGLGFDTAGHSVLAQRLSAPRRRFWTTGPAIEPPPDLPAVYLWRSLPADAFAVRWEEGLDFDEMTDRLIAVRTKPFTCTLRLPRLRTKDSYPVRVSIMAAALMGSPEQFFNAFGSCFFGAAQSVLTRDVTAYAERIIAPPLGDRIREFDFSELQERFAIGLGEVLTLANNCFENNPAMPNRPVLSILSVSGVEYRSTLGESAIEQSDREIAFNIRHRQQQLDATPSQSEPNGHRTKIRSKRGAMLEASERVAETELADVDLEFNRTANAVAREPERSRIRHELESDKIARLCTIETFKCGDIAERKTARLKAESVLRRTGVATNAAADEGIPQLDRFRWNVRQRQEAGVAEGVTSATRQASPEANALHPLTGAKPQARQAMASLVRDRHTAAPTDLIIWQEALTACDLGTVPFAGIKVGTRICFKIQTCRSGFLTILGIGTSGQMTLLAPNGLVGPEKAHIVAGDIVDYPGPRLLPVASLFVQGPPGWEEVLAIVSDAPLIGFRELLETSRNSPSVLFSDEMARKLTHTLEQRTTSWSGATLRMCVED